MYIEDDSQSNATALTSQSGFDTGLSEDEDIVILGSAVDTPSDSIADSASVDFGQPLNEFNKPVDATRTPLPAQMPSTESSSKDVNSPGDQAHSVQQSARHEAARPPAPDLIPTTQQEGTHEPPDSTNASSPQPLLPPPPLPQTDSTAGASSLLPSNDTPNEGSSPLCSLNDLSALDSAAQIRPAPLSGTSNVILNRLHSEDTDSGAVGAGPGEVAQPSPLTEVSKIHNLSLFDNNMQIQVVFQSWLCTIMNDRSSTPLLELRFT